MTPELFPARAEWLFWLDVVLLGGFLLAGGWLAFTRRPARRILALLVLALLYFGLWRGGCICPVGATSAAAIGVLHPDRIGRATVALFLLPLAAALWRGRVFCGSVCPIGAVQHLCRGRAPAPWPRPLVLALSVLPVLVLVLTVAGAWGKGLFLPCRLDPYHLLFAQGRVLADKASALAGGGWTEAGWIGAGDPAAWALLGVALLAGLAVPRVFCRLVCPYGALLGVMALAAFRRREMREDSCTGCGACVKACPVQAMRRRSDRKAPEISAYRCVQCGLCASTCRRT